MKKLLLAAGIAGVVYYLRRNPDTLNSMKNTAMDTLDKYTGKL